MKRLIPSYIRKINNKLPIRQTLKILLDLLFPQNCLGCGKNDAIICKNCRESIPEAEDSANSENNPSSIPTIAAACYKNEILKKAIWLLKYKKIKTVAEPLSELISDRCVEDLSEINTFYSIRNCLIIPIPISKRRLRERGFNQAGLIAFNLTKKMTINMPTINFLFEQNILKKTRETSSQVLMKDRTKRLKNLKGSFRVESPEKVKDKNIILVDDVSTTGATLHEATSVLKKAGARIIIPIVVAK
ncbi:MAG: ComF family protein [Parcubacteria group bacterium]|nr:ComF family protein [Parcubacteria group bacterium]MCR4342763.1 ComF family protein [Patescibacteria group bacterium]